MNQSRPLPFAALIIAAAAGIGASAPAKPMAPVSQSTYNYYVSLAGSDSNPGTAALPFQSILRASKVALPGTTIHVAPGTYEGGFKTTMSGTESQRIYYVSTVTGGARLVPPMTSETKAAWDNRGSYVDIVGFDIDGSAARNGIKWTHGIYNGGSFAVIRHNRVHHIAQDTPCNGGGAAGIGVDSYYHGVQGDVIGNVVHDIGPPGCRFMQGIHISTSGSARNNIVHNIGGAAIQMWHDANNVIVTNNTVAASMTGILVGGGDFYHTKGPNDFTVVHNNIVYDNKVGISEQGATGVHNSYRNNLVFQSSNADWQLRNGLTHSGTIAQAPQFVRYARRGEVDFRLRAGSPAIGKGVEEHAALTDATGKLRSKAAGIDIGAYQFK
ncbi:MAG: right-handed parallel beta-helix repeat-containing protein [Pseudomonadota bacterium]